MLPIDDPSGKTITSPTLGSTEDPASADKVVPDVIVLEVGTFVPAGGRSVLLDPAPIPVVDLQESVVPGAIPVRRANRRRVQPRLVLRDAHPRRDVLWGCLQGAEFLGQLAFREDLGCPQGDDD